MSNEAQSLNDFVYLHLCRDEGPYRTGETIYGTVTYDFTQCRNYRAWNLKSLELVKLVFVGRAEICEIGEIPEMTEWFLNHETLFTPNTIGQRRLRISTYPFSINLPNELPISFNHDGFRIIYKVSAFLIFGNRKYFGPSITFQVTRKINLQLNPLANSSFTLRNYKTYGRIGLIKLDWRRGTIKYKISIDPRGFTPGERVTFDCLIDNDTNKEIDIARVYFREVFIRDYQGSTQILKCRDQNPGRFNCTLPPFTNRFWMGTLEIPQRQYLTTPAINCDLLRVEHYIIFELLESNGKSEKLLLRGLIQIYIGDIGLGNNGSSSNSGNDVGESSSIPISSHRIRGHRRMNWSRSPPKYDTILEEFEALDNPPPTYDEAMEFACNRNNNSSDGSSSSAGPSQIAIK